MVFEALLSEALSPGACNIFHQRLDDMNKLQNWDSEHTPLSQDMVEQHFQMIFQDPALIFETLIQQPAIDKNSCVVSANTILKAGGLR